MRVDRYPSKNQWLEDENLKIAFEMVPFWETFVNFRGGMGGNVLFPCWLVK